MNSLNFDKSELLKSDLEYEGRNFNDINFEIKLKKKLQDKIIDLLQMESDEIISPKKFVLDCKHTVIKVLNPNDKQESDLKKDEKVVYGLMTTSKTKQQKV